MPRSPLASAASALPPGVLQSPGRHAFPSPLQAGALQPAQRGDRGEKGVKFIEIDGDTHAGREATDAERTRWLQEQKHYKVIRFTNHDVLKHTEAVIEEIRAALNPKQ
jgi:hypothetical protein